MASFYLGIDGGQSSTTALIADETGRVIGSGRGGPCNHITGLEAREKFRRVVGDCLSRACAQASLHLETIQFASTCCGFSGGAADKEQYTRELIRSELFKITHDAEIALTGALTGKPGIVVIAGTGSIAFGRNAQGQTARAGGWGYVFGDEGGAFDLVRGALRAALQHEEGWGPPTKLHTNLLAATGEKSANELLHRFYATPRSEVARYAPLVTQAADADDSVALTIIDESAAGLAWYAEGVRRQLFEPVEQPPVTYVGGVFESAALLSAFSRHVGEFGCEINAPRFGPAAGALLEAFRLAGRTMPVMNLPISEQLSGPRDY
jgi:N-acetylglucosamine kinase-like BadF-type ATPase